MKILENVRVRQIAVTLLVTALVALMTGPSGSNESPSLGFTDSFGQSFSFFGLFPGQRWMVFLVLGLAVYGLKELWRTRKSALRPALTSVANLRQTTIGQSSVRRTGLVIILVAAVAMPHVLTDPFWQQAMVEQIAVYVLLALGLNVVVGFAGLLDLGYVGFYAVGAYATAWATGALPLSPILHHIIPTFFSIPVAIVVVMISGVLLGLPTLRLRGDYLAIVTLGFGEIILIFATNLTNITGGSQGTGTIPFFGLHLGSLKYYWGLGPVPYYYLTLVFVIGFIVIFRALEHSRIGRAWTAIREDEIAAESVGINPLKFKVMAFAIGASTAGFAGAITAGQNGVIFPNSFSLTFSINVLALVIFGGMGSISGVVIGAVAIQFFTEYLLHSPPSGYQPADLYMYLGALLVVMMIFRPQGLLPSRRRQREIIQAEAGIGHGDEVLMGEAP